jgi:hypothetical protein
MSAQNVAAIARTEITPRTTPVAAHAAPLATIAVTQVTTGITGPSGLTGGGDGAPAYLHNQPVAAATWTVNHNLGYRPAVSALSVGGVVMLVNVIHASANQAVIEFDQPTAGQAACS